MIMAAIFLTGCAGPGPRTFPAAPLQTVNRGDIIENRFDLDHDAKADFSEFIKNGRVDEIAYADNEGDRVRLSAVQTAHSPHLLIILDSVPYELVREAWDAGRFRYFHAPSIIISPFPVMTDPALAEFFGASPCEGVESVHFDGTKLVAGYSAYLLAENAPWLAHVDYHLNNGDHAWAYLWPGMWFRRELHDIQTAFADFPPKIDPGILAPRREFVGYCVGTSALGSKRGRDGHHYALVELDRFCRQLIYDRRGDVQITLMSDHGHALHAGRRLDLSHELERMGYRVGRSLRSPQDVVVPEFGLVSCAAVHTLSPASVARDGVGLSGVELACYRESAPGGAKSDDCVIVVARDGEARITEEGGRLRYHALRGDPLKLNAINANAAGIRSPPLSSPGDYDEFFRRSLDLEYPDPLDRLWRAFHGLFRHTPDVLLSLEDGYYAGSEELTHWLEMQAIHGNLNAGSSMGFVMTTSGPLPGAMRMRDVRPLLTAKRDGP